MADAGWFSVAQCFKAYVLFLVVSLSQCQTLSTACIEVKKAYAAKGFDENEVPLKAVSGEELTICPRTETCCTRDMEDKLTSLSRKEYVRQLEESFKLLKTTFASRTKKFDDFFVQLIDKAQLDLHEMFLQTYGLLYQQNAAIFTKLFTDLRHYYKGKDMNLSEVMDSFFSKLLQRVFELVNSGYVFTSDYLGCVTDKMNDLKPFGEVPIKLSTQVRKAFIAARTFVQGLSIGKDVINSVFEITPSEACIKAFVKMTYCPHCRGLTSTRPCNNYCLNTLKGCLAYQSDLNVPWNEFI
ncbi:glypican-6, partial [Biomphalaria glabrata]